MPSFLSSIRLKFIISQFSERLWVKPLVFALASVGAVFLAELADGTGLGKYLPELSADSIDSLLKVMASSMLVIATFAVGSMVSAYASTSNNATPRSVSLVISDDVSQNALSMFLGAFIFSVVGLIAVKNRLYGNAGLFTLFVLMSLVFAVVVLTFVRWVDRIARLGRLGFTIESVEQATTEALLKRRDSPTHFGAEVSSDISFGQPVFSTAVGYVQHINFPVLQAIAEQAAGRIVVAALPGSFVAPGHPLAYLISNREKTGAFDYQKAIGSFAIGSNRTFFDDPRFGFLVLAQIADRALSPGINDPGTAIDVIVALLRLFVLWASPREIEDDKKALKYDRVEVPELSLDGMFDDSFTAIARDGAGAVEVMVRLQEALSCLARIGDSIMRETAIRHSRMALARAEAALTLPEDLQAVREAAAFSNIG